MYSSPENRGYVPPDEAKKAAAVPPTASVPPSDTDKDREAVEKFIDASLEELCERYLSKFNEGNNGIVLKLRMDDIPPDLKDGLKQNGIELGDDKVAKILKIYSGGKGRQEFEMQKKAHELVEAQADKAKFAKVPKPYFYRDFEVGPDAQERIKGMTQKGFGGNRVEMFMMDYVPGDDVATVLYKEVVKRHPNTVDVAEKADDLRFEDLQDRVFQALEFKVPGGKSRDIGEREHEMRKVFAENAAKIDTFLERRGFRMDPAVVAQIENTMELFHKNGIAFRDGHQRNFMLTGDYGQAQEGKAKDKPPQVFIIDYGAATEIAGRKLEDVYREVEGDEGGGTVKQYVDDLMVARQLRRFTEPLGTEERKVLEDLAKAKKAAERNSRLAPHIEAAIGAARAGKTDMASSYAKLVGSSTMPSEGAIDHFLSLAYAVMEAEPASKEDVRAFVTDLTKRKLPLPVNNKLGKFLRATK